MKKFRRSGRLVDMTNYLIQNPHQLIPLTYFSDRYESAKSSISEDLTIIKEIFESQDIGVLLTVAGASGGVKYIPTANEDEIVQSLKQLCMKLEDANRVLPGGYLYMMDIIGNPKLMNEIGRYFATLFAGTKVDVIMTMATKGIPLAYAVATYLNVPVCIVRHEHRITEGSLVSINYVSGSTKRIQTMSLAKRSLNEGSNVLIIDDFMKAGGTIRGMISLVEEFNSNVVGTGVLVEAEHTEERLVDEYISMTRLSEVNTKEKIVKVEIGNFFEKLKNHKQQVQED
ncbi:pur operon repressor [Anaerobacillus arseniciselenatis]|uniref:Pur operon repressor n=1 Tax=Anaerobacillus arseniciselenatis TaxID=85682 RepID=A0A1S2LPN1_9BACI|nr:pur operon repressor [Anaerobacillus arseniciselenatis]OIJ14468.1 pur operon repressor [Anaerobacillus arseniciselenatis]